MRSYLRKMVVLTLVLVQMMCMTAFAQNSATAAALEKVNAIRVANGLSEVRYDASLEQAANVRAQEASTSFSHTRPDGSAWYTVNDALMYGENLAEGYNSADEVVDAWMASPTHRANILSSQFTTCSFSTYTVNGTTYWAQEFGIAA